MIAAVTPTMPIARSNQSDNVVLPSIGHLSPTPYIFASGFRFSKMMCHRHALRPFVADGLLGPMTLPPTLGII